MDTGFAAILIFEIVTFWVFYSTRHGRKAVYRSWYAWIIDVCGIASGTFLMWLAVHIKTHRELFTIDVPLFLPFILFLLGSWQAVIHGVKWLRRTTTK
jgi:hypothetical protein